ncbi:hypothetical protein GNF51_14785 [Clostridium perfringens]|nr:hypothetical protein [Clostridium perfringens]
MSLINGIPIFSSGDDCIKELQSKYLSHGFAICSFIFIVGELILLMIPGQSLKIIMLYPII